MLTIKLPISISSEDQDFILNLQRQQSCVIRSTYSTDLGEKALRTKFKDFQSISDLDSWFIQSAIRDGLAMRKADQELISKTKLKHRWKEASTWVYESWKDLHQILKNSKVKYRVPVPEGAVFREMSNRKSLVLQVSF